MGNIAPCQENVMKKLMLVGFVCQIVAGWVALTNGNVCQALVLFGSAAFLAKHID